MPTCAKCGNALTEGVETCASCGTATLKATAEIAPSVAPVGSPSPRLLLEVTSEAGKGTTFELHADDVIGQSDDCGVPLPFDKFASEAHAKVTCGEGALLVEDQGSLNGTYIRISGRVKLEPGMEILVGTTRLLVKSL